MNIIATFIAGAPIKVGVIQKLLISIGLANMPVNYCDGINNYLATETKMGPSIQCQVAKQTDEKGITHLIVTTKTGETLNWWYVHYKNKDYYLHNFDDHYVMVLKKAIREANQK